MTKIHLNDEFTVLLEVKTMTGHKVGYWQPAMTPEEFEQWWLNLENVNRYFISYNELPGKVIIVSNKSERDELMELAEKGGMYIACLILNKNSYLSRPDNTRLYHKGRTEPDNLQYDIAGKLNVLMKEEYGFRNWIWQPGMSPVELEEWWKNLESAWSYFFNPANLPGLMLLVDTEEQIEQYKHMEGEGIHYSGHIHMDDDSFIKSPEGRTIRHKGYGRKEVDPDTPVYL
jgi:hypothetical protein